MAAASKGLEFARLRIQIFHVATVRTKSGPALAGGEGGGVVHCVRLAQEWARQGHLVTVYTNLPDMFEGRCSQVITVGGTNQRPVNPGAGTLLQPLKALIGSLTNRTTISPVRALPFQFPEASIVIAASPNLSDIIPAARLAKGSYLPLIVTFHHLTPVPWWYPTRRGGVVRCTGAWILNQVALVITKVCGFVPSIDQLRILSESGWIFSGPVLRDEIFLDNYPDSGTMDARDRPIDVCFVSRLSPMKGLFDIVSIWIEVHRRLPGACLVVGGDFESEAVERRFRLAIERAGLTECILLRGHLSDKEKYDLLGASKIFAYPSYEEGWSIAVMEAAAYGCVPVVYDLPAYDYLGPATPRVLPGNVQAFAERLVDLLCHSQKRKEIAADLEATPRAFTAERSANDQIAFFREQLRRGPNHRDLCRRP